MSGFFNASSAPVATSNASKFKINGLMQACYLFQRRDQLFKQRWLSRLCKVTAFAEFLAEWRNELAVLFSLKVRAARSAARPKVFKGGPQIRSMSGRNVSVIEPIT
jgi:hypothetical protein